MTELYPPQYFDDCLLESSESDWENRTFYSDSTEVSNSVNTLSNSTCFLLGFLVGALIFMSK